MQECLRGVRVSGISCQPSSIVRFFFTRFGTTYSVEQASTFSSNSKKAWLDYGRILIFSFIIRYSSKTDEIECHLGPISRLCKSWIVGWALSST